MTQPIAVDVHILDKEYRVMCPPEQRDELIASAHRLDAQMREIRDHGRIIGTERIAVMAALNIAHELMQRESSQHELESINSRLRRITQRIDEALA
ncbi:cell division protein ZapA [Acidihalobacter ferrooxydans]|uniref:Cell division protein ZapA n=1 Tax=Acidihalobacter ferrooxydans TaxID=1765967 RepID=A0A1P8UIS8_9GAMM|nr:cell division protein ZapA [Acidihalobacter ferrooxydans]APZ43714.1 cell division protein ZapA [Acidihalobacter ferrooxydans]